MVAYWLHLKKNVYIPWERYHQNRNWFVSLIEWFHMSVRCVSTGSILIRSCLCESFVKDIHKVWAFWTNMPFRERALVQDIAAIYFAVASNSSSCVGVWVAHMCEVKFEICKQSFKFQSRSVLRFVHSQCPHGKDRLNSMTFWIHRFGLSRLLPIDSAICNAWLCVCSVMMVKTQR